MDKYYIARLAYGAYANTTDNKNFLGNQMPCFDELPEIIKEAWAAAAVEARAAWSHC